MGLEQTARGSVVSNEAGDVGKSLSTQRLMGHGQGFGFFPGKNGKLLKGRKWKGEGSSYCDVENGCTESRGDARSSRAAMPLSRQGGPDWLVATEWTSARNSPHPNFGK